MACYYGTCNNALLKHSFSVKEDNPENLPKLCQFCNKPLKWEQVEDFYCQEDEWLDDTEEKHSKKNDDMKTVSLKKKNNRDEENKMVFPPIRDDEEEYSSKRNKKLYEKLFRYFLKRK